MSQVTTYSKGQKNFDFPHDRDLKAMLSRRVSETPDRAAYVYRGVPRGEIHSKTYAELQRDILALGAAMLAEEIAAPQPLRRDEPIPQRERISVIGDNSYYWAVAETCALFGLGLAIPLDRLLSVAEVVSLVNRSATTIFFFDAKQEETARQVAAQCPSVRTFICMDVNGESVDSLGQEEHLLQMSDLLESGCRLLAEGSNPLAAMEIDPDAPAALYFTSGTTAQSKGVLLSHHNLTSNASATLRSIDVPPAARALSLLPLHHTFENTAGMYMMWSVGLTIHINDGLRYIAGNIKDWKIEVVLCVPLVLENIYKQIQANIRKQGLEKKFQLGLKISNLLLKLGIDKRKSLFRAVHDALGGEMKLLISGAAALSPEIQAFYNQIGIDCFVGYGLTESSPVVAVCNQTVNSIGSVGQPLCDVEIKIDCAAGNGDSEDAEHLSRCAGEILTRSDSVMLGYYENEEATREAIDSDGWLHTGDVGYFDESGSLVITGRKKSMIVLTNGKKVFPEEIESLLQEIPGVAHAMAWGETNQRGNIDICARFQINPDQLPDDMKNKLAANEQAFIGWMENQLTEINQKMASFKEVRYFVWSEHPMVMTSTLKIKREPSVERTHAWLQDKELDMRLAHGRRIED